MRIIGFDELASVSGGLDIGEVPQSVIDELQKKGLWEKFLGALGTYYTLKELMGDIDALMNSIPRQDLQWGSQYNGLGSPGDGTVPGDPIGGGCSAGGSPLQAYYWEERP